MMGPSMTSSLEVWKYIVSLNAQTISGLLDKLAKTDIFSSTANIWKHYIEDFIKNKQKKTPTLATVMACDVN